MTPDPWKRPSAVDDAADVMSGYERQLELQLNKPVEATPEEFEEWREMELDWWANKQFKFVALATLVQLRALGFMALVMITISLAFN